MNKKHSIDMCSGSLADKILLFALPLMASSLLQLLFNAADVVVVGRFAGKEALAAVGSNTSLINLTVNLFVGLSVGTNVVVSRDLDIYPECLSMARKHQRTLLHTADTTVLFTSKVIEYLTQALAPTITRHGGLLDIYGEGVLITGDSGVGKSETAIELIKRGHRLVADDAVEIKETSHHTLVATSPELIRGYMELRGIGVIDISRLLGMGAIKLSQEIDMVVNLEPWDDSAVYDRFGLESHFTEIMGVKVPCSTIPVKPGRNLASIVEVAAMNNRNRKMGHNAAQELTNRMDKIFAEQLEGDVD